MHALELCKHHETGAPDVARWIPPATLDRFPLGPYAVHAYFPRTRREYTARNHLPETAARCASELAAHGADVHVSVDTCG